MARSDASPSRDPHVLRPDHRPTPFTAAEIRDGSHVGRTVRQVVEAEGVPTVTRIVRWVEKDADGATSDVVVLDATGTEIERYRSHSRWLDLQRHASMPIATTTIDRVTLESPMGALECLRYTRLDGDATDTFWFARSMAGMPVRTERAEHGRVVERVTMVADEVRPLPDERFGDGAVASTGDA